MARDDFSAEVPTTRARRGGSVVDEGRYRTLLKHKRLENDGCLDDLSRDRRHRHPTGMAVGS